MIACAANAFRPWFLRTASVLAKSAGRDLAGQIQENLGQLGSCHLPEVPPLRRRNGDQHAVVGGRDLSRQVVAGDPLAELAAIRLYSESSPSNDARLPDSFCFSGPYCS